MQIVRASAAALALVSFVPSVHAQSAAPLFDRPQVQPGGYASALADLDGDGHLDAVVGGGDFGHTLSVWRGNGAGELMQSSSYVLDGYPSSISIGDLDGIGGPDLVVTNSDVHTLSVLLSIGPGVYAPPTSYAIGGAAFRGNLADFDGDGALDVVVLTNVPYGVEIFLGDGHGGLRPPIKFAISSNLNSVLSMVVVDANRDSHPDLVITDSKLKTMSVWLGDGHGGFASITKSSSILAAQDLVAGDFDGDGIDDLVMTSSSNMLGVARGDGHGGFGAVGFTALDAYIAKSRLLDIDGDGRLDLVSIAQSKNELRIFRGNGYGAFGASQKFDVLESPGILSLSLGDFDGDGRVDALVTGIDHATLLHGDGIGGFFSPPELTYEVVGGMASADLNGDGHPDVVAAIPIAKRVQVLVSDGSGGFASNLVKVGARPTKIAVADLDGDGVPDLATANGDDGSVSVLRGLGAANFAAPTLYPVGQIVADIAVGDFNNDGLPDLAVVESLYGEVWILLGTGQGAFAAPTPVARCRGSNAIALGDVDQDGNLDLVFSNFASYSTPWFVTLVRGDGYGGFDTPREFPVDDWTTAIVLADLNGDGALDVAAASESTGAISVLIGDGHGRFGPAVPHVVFRDSNPGLVGSMSLRVGDVNGDGRVDLVASGFNRGSIAVLLGNGLGEFHPSQLFAANTLPNDFVLGDWNDDGQLDVAVGGGDPTVTPVALCFLLQQGKCPPASSYCVSKVNSQFCEAVITSVGRASMSSSTPFTISASSVINQKYGMLFYGTHAAVLPFQGGTLCVEPPLARTPPRSSGGSSPSNADCTGSFALDFNALIQSGSDPTLVAGAKLYAQYWYRDPQDFSGFGTGLSNALQFTICE